MRVLVREPNSRWEIKCVPNTLKAFQDLVGGHIEVIGWAFPDAIAIVDDEAKLSGKAPNILGLAGTVVVCGMHKDKFIDIPNRVEKQLYRQEAKKCK